MPDTIGSFEVYASVDVFNCLGEACRLQFPVKCGPRIVVGELPVVGRFRMEGLQLEYLGFEGRPYVRTLLHFPGQSLVDVHENMLPSYPIGMGYVPVDHSHQLSGRRLDQNDYRMVGLGDPNLTEVYGDDVVPIMKRAAEDLQAAVGRRFISSRGQTYSQAAFPTWMVDPVLNQVRLEAPAFACAPDRHLLRFGVSRLKDACTYLAAIQAAPAAVANVVGSVTAVDPTYDDRNDAAQICIAANAYLGEILDRLILDMPGPLVCAWRELREIETIVQAGEAWRASRVVPHLLSLMDHAEASGCVDPRKAGPRWSNLRTRLVSVEGVMPSLHESPGGHRP